MSLYYEAAQILEDLQRQPRPLKDIIYKGTNLKSPPGSLFALLSETATWSPVLSEVIEESGLLALEKKLTSALALVLVHDLLVSKKGLATNKSHNLHIAVSKHKARLGSELTKCRIRRGCATLDALRSQLRQDGSQVGGFDGSFYPRWVRINTILTSSHQVFATALSSFEAVPSLNALSTTVKGVYVDEHVPSLLAVHPSVDMTKTDAYKKGHIILQDKASCFPACLLDATRETGKVIDGCAAPGNKTTHLAAILAEKCNDLEMSQQVRISKQDEQIIACERDKARAETLKSMVNKAGAGRMVSVRAGQDFLALNPQAAEWNDVAAILLDPSCSGSGIVGRDDGDESGGGKSDLRFVLPKNSGQRQNDAGRPKKRKRTHGINGDIVNHNTKSVVGTAHDAGEPDGAAATSDSGAALEQRLRALSAFQLKLLTHAMRFPNATRITYSTCSVHPEENEQVVVKALTSEVALERGWKVMTRDAQVEGMRRWSRRGDKKAVEMEVSRLHKGGFASSMRGSAVEEIFQACIRCAKGTDEGTMGFFVVGFVRDVGATTNASDENGFSTATKHAADIADEEEEWAGFSD